jgi:hypothetical protein
LRAPAFIRDQDFKVILWLLESETDQATDQAEKRVMLVLKLLDTPRKRSELQELLGIKHNHTFRHNYIEPAVERGYIAQSHPDKLLSKLPEVPGEKVAWPAGGTSRDDPKFLIR